MKTHLHFLKSKFLLLCSFLISLSLYAQSTIATYDFMNTLRANEYPLQPDVKYYNSSGNEVTPNYANGGAFGGGSRMLSTNDDGSYIELTIDTRGYDGINVAWEGQVNAGFYNYGTWSLYADAGSGYSVNPLISMTPFNFILFFHDIQNTNFTLEPAAGNNEFLKIKIKSSDISSQLRLDKLIITSRSPKINVFGYNTTNNLTQIPVNAPAATAYGTDFDMVITSAITSTGYTDRVFRIQNNGAADLNISSVSFSGDNPADFSITSALPTPVSSGGGTKDFTIRFNPFSDGKSTAILNIYSNAKPSPYSYEVEGRGASCKSEDLIFKNNTMETGTQSLPATPDDVSSFNKISNTNYTNTSSTLLNNTRLYGPTKNDEYNLYNSSNSSWYVRNETSTMNFGVDVTNEKGVFISFKLAAFSTGNNVTFTNSDVVKLEVLDPVTNLWSNEAEIRGNNANTPANSRFSFTSASLLEGIYDGDNLPIGGPGKYSTVKLKLRSSSNFVNLIFRITAISSASTKLWLIDDVSVSTANAIFKTYTGTGLTGWKNSANIDTPVPIIEEKAIINGAFIGNLTACECEVLPEKSVLLNSGNLMTLENKLNNNGTFTIESDGNLIQNDNTAINAGNITSKRAIKVGAARNQYNYLGTPVDFAAGETFKTIYPGATYVLYHNETNNMFYNSSGVNVPGRGLAVKEPTGIVAGTVTALFKGIPQNGTISLPITNKDSNPAVTTFGYNLVGNPYPSNIDLQKLYNINGGKTSYPQSNSPNISATFYFWDNNVNDIYTQQGNTYEGQAYAVFNVLTGTNGTGTAAGSLSGPIVGTKFPTKIVKVGQGFMTRSLVSSYNFKFNNSIRTNATSTVDFLGKGNAEVEDDRYWLKMTAPSGITSTIAIVHYPGGNDLFGTEDSRTMGGSDVLYGIVEDEKIAINGRAGFANTDIIPLGTDHFVSGNYTIALGDKEGVFANGQNIYLKDNQTATVTNLSEGSYTFAANVGESTGRFEIIYQPEIVLVTNNIVKDGIVVYRANDDFVIKSPKTITTVEVYDLSGKLITVLQANDRQTVLNASYLGKGMYLLRIKTTDGEITNKKIIKQ